MRVMLTPLPFLYNNIVIVFGAPSASFSLAPRCCLCSLPDRVGFSCYPGSVSNCAVGTRRWRAAHGRARAKKARNHPSCRRWNCRHFSARFHRKDKDLAVINTIWISDLVPVRFVNDGVSHARAVRDTADAPEAVARGYDRGRYL